MHDVPGSVNGNGMPRYCVLSAPVENNTMPFGSILEPLVVIVAVPAGQFVDCAAVAVIGVIWPLERQPTPKRPIAIAGLVGPDVVELAPDAAS